MIMSNEIYRFYIFLLSIFMSVKLKHILLISILEYNKLKHPLKPYKNQPSNRKAISMHPIKAQLSE